MRTCVMCTVSTAAILLHMQWVSGSSNDNLFITNAALLKTPTFNLFSAFSTPLKITANGVFSFPVGKRKSTIRRDCVQKLIEFLFL